jgi:hypothetical protein
VNTEVITDTNTGVTTIVSNNDITIGTREEPFGAGYFDSGRFGFIEMSGNAMIPIRNGVYDLGTKSRKFGNIYAKTLSIVANTMHVLDESGNNLKMSYDLDNQKIAYDVFADDGATEFKIYSIENKDNTLDEKYLPYNGLTYYALVEPSYNIIDTITTQVFTDLTMTNAPEQKATGIYIVMKSDGVIDAPTNHLIVRNADGLDYDFEQTIWISVEIPWM